MKWIECKVEDGIRRVLMVKDPIAIGRSATCELSFPEDRDVSRLHAVIELRGDHWFLIDQKSTNGSFINGQRATVPFPLKEGDLIQIGEQRLHVKSGLFLGVQDSGAIKYLGYPHHYVVLKLDVGATSAEIDEAYQRLLKIFNPELHPDNPMIPVLLKELNEAYDVLSHAARREEYDLTLRQSPPKDA